MFRCRWAGLFFALVFGLILWPASLPAEPGDDGNFSFVVMGDNRTGGEDPVEQPQVFKEMIKEVNLLSPDLVIMVGDLIRGYTDDAQLIEREWDEFDRTIAAFEAPTFLVPGNHDIWDKESEAIYKRRYKKLYYTFTYGNSAFIVLFSEDESYRGRISRGQVRWLEEELKKAQGKEHIFVLVHRPLWGEDEEKTDWDLRVHPLLKRFKVDAVFAGHVHVYRKSPTRDGVRYYITGGAGAPLGQGGWEFLGGFYHFLFITVKGKETRIAVIKPGNIKDEEVVTTASLRRARGILAGLGQVEIIVQPGKEIAGEAELKVSNPLKDEVRSKISWEVSQRWQVLPEEIEFRLLPGETKEITFQVLGPRERIYPPPTYTVETFYQERPLVDLRFPLILEVRERLFVRTAVVPPRIDGILEEKVWQEAEKATPFILSNGQGLALAPTLGQVAYDDENLYIAFTCQEPNMDEVVANSKTHDGRVWNDDCVEVFIDTNLDHKTYIHLMVNIIGIRFEAKNGDRAWNPKWRAVARKGKDAWTVEMEIPFASLRVAKPRKGKIWGLNLNRERQAGGGEASSWSCTFGSFHAPNRFGELHFK